MRPLVALLALAVACSTDPADQRAMCPPVDGDRGRVIEVDGGACVYGCDSRYTTCGDSGTCATRVIDDPNNCGACGSRCLEGQRCVGGACMR